MCPAFLQFRCNVIHCKMKANNNEPQLIFLACLVFGMGEFKLMLCVLLTVLHADVQSRFHRYLMICKGVLATCH